MIFVRVYIVLQYTLHSAHSHPSDISIWTNIYILYVCNSLFIVHFVYQTVCVHYLLMILCGCGLWSSVNVNCEAYLNSPSTVLCFDFDCAQHISTYYCVVYRKWKIQKTIFSFLENSISINIGSEFCFFTLAHQKINDIQWLKAGCC